MVSTCLVSLALIVLGDSRVSLEPLGRFDLKQIPEASGVVKSRRHPDVFWVVNDSGNAPMLFAVTREGRILKSFPVAAANLDWEDLAIDDQGRLYIGDIGSNKGLLGLRGVYRIDEPDPNLPVGGPLKPTTSSWYAMPYDDRFDAESLVYDGDRAVVVTKRFDGREAELREVPFNPPAPLLKPISPRRIGVLPGFVEPATGADLSPDGRLLVVCGNRVARVYERPDGPDWDALKLIAVVEIREKQQIEGVAWDGMDLIFASEGHGVDRIPEATWRKALPSPAAATPRIKKSKKHERAGPATK